MSEQTKPPTLPLEVQQRLRIHALEVKTCRLTYANAELALKVADKEAALESIRLTNERDELAGLVNTNEWRYDFDAEKFVPRHRPPATNGTQRVTVEALVLGGKITFETDIAAVPVGQLVRVRVRYPATADYPKDVEPLVSAAVAHLRPEDVQIGRVPVTDLEEPKA